jgi:NTP pyrophosphatase (non-canonical NTP hydrolase)
MSGAERYCLGLLTEEMAEAAQLVGKSLRFGIDTPGPDAAPYHGANARQLLELELGDVLAAIRFAELHGVVDAYEVADRCDRKLAKLLDPTNKDNLGRQLAPTPPCYHPSNRTPPQREWRP